MNIRLSPSSLATSPAAICAKRPEDVVAPMDMPASGVEAQLPHLTVISPNTFFRTCFTHCLAQMTRDFDIRSFVSSQEWLEKSELGSDEIVLLCVTGQRATEEAIRQSLDTIMQERGESRVMIISDIDQPSHAIEAVEKGAKGYVSMGLDLEIALGAIKLVSVGGTFIPASSLMSMRTASSAGSASRGGPSGATIFSGRQLEVLEHLRRGDPNKIIAYKTSLSEATVKVHVRNMMQKIKAKNRTELVCKSNEMLERFPALSSRTLLPNSSQAAIR